MSQIWSIVFVALLFVAYEGGFVEAVCPASQEEAEASAKQCLRRVGLDMDVAGAGGSMANDDINRMKQYCKDGTLEEALGCVELIINACKEQDRDLTEALGKAISISRLRTGFRYMCDNLQVVLDHGDCIRDQQSPVATCVQVETQKFQTELQARQNQGSGPSNPDDIWRMSCGFMDRLFSCQHNIYRENCGQEIADVMTTFMQSAKPPICDELSGATAISVSWSLLAGLFSLYLYLRE